MLKKYFGFLGIVITVCLPGVNIYADQISEDLKANQSKLLETPVRFVYSMKIVDYFPNGEVVEAFPDGTVSFKSPELFKTSPDQTTHPVILKGAKLADGTQIYLTSTEEVNLVQWKGSQFYTAIFNGADNTEFKHSHLTKDGGRWLLEEKKSEDGSVRLMGYLPLPDSPEFYKVRFTLAYEFFRNLNPEPETVSTSSIRYTSTHDDGWIVYDVNTEMGVTTKKATKNSKGETELILSDYQKVGDFYLPGRIEETRKNRDGEMLKKMVVTDCRYEILTPEEAEKALTLEFPEGTEISNSPIPMGL